MTPEQSVATSPSTLEDHTSFADAESVLKALERYLGQQHPLTISISAEGPNVVLDTQSLTELYTRLSHANTISRYEDIRDNRPEIPEGNKVTFWLASMLVSHFKVRRGRNAANVAITLLDTLAKEPTQLVGTTETVEIKGILTAEMLDNAVGLVSILGSPGSIEDQLNDHVLVDPGLVITPVRSTSDNEESGFALPTALLEILKSLKHPESAEVLESWLYDSLVDETANSINFLRNLVQFTVFLDSDSFFQLYASEGENEIPLLPFRSIHKAVNDAISYLNDMEGFSGAVDTLKEIEQLINTRFSQLAIGPLKDSVEASSVTSLAPHIDEVALMYTEWFIDRIDRNIPHEEAVRHAVSLVSQYGAQNTKEFVNIVGALLEDISSRTDIDKLLTAIKMEFARHQVQTATNGELQGIIMRNTLNKLITEPWIDVVDMDFNNIIHHNTQAVQIFLVPGTFGPFTAGHADLIHRLKGYTRYLDKYEETDEVTQRLIMLVPLTKTKGVKGYNKDWASAGSINVRTSSIMLQLAAEERDKVLITTALQPDPIRIGNIGASINATMHNVTAKIVSDLNNIGRTVPFSIDVVGVYGSDEFNWKGTKDGSVLDTTQPKKVRRQCVIIARYGTHGGLIDILNNPIGITDYTRASVVLTPGTPKNSSTAAIEAIRAGDYTSFLTQAVPYVKAHWSQSAIEVRRNQNKSEDKIPSVTEMCKSLIKEYRRLVT